MPLIQVNTIKGVSTPEMKKQVIEKLTDAMVSIEGGTSGGRPGSRSTRSTAGTGASAARP